MQTKKILTTLSIIAVILYIVSSIVVKTSTPTPKIKEVPPPVVTTTTVTVQALTYATTSGTILIEYPVFSNMPVLNSKIKKEAESLFATTTKELNDSVQSMIDFNVDMSGRSLVFEQKIDRSRMYINNKTNIASIVYKSYTDMGGAHGSFFYGSRVYDLKTGTELVLDDVLQNYQSTVRTYVQTQISNATTTSTTCVNCEALGGRTDPGAQLISQRFYLDAKGLTLLYSAYDLGAYAITSAGQEVLIPINTLTGLVKRVW